MRTPHRANLRLVGGSGDAPLVIDHAARVLPTGADEVIARRIAVENRTAARAVNDLTESDARWILAARAADAMGSGGLLGPEQRDRLLRTATRMGLRSFDANLVLAIVQDAARRGESPLSRASAERLTHVGRAEPRDSRGPIGSSAIAVFVLASVVFWLLVYWVTGGIG